jgi:hypothetical protein
VRAITHKGDLAEYMGFKYTHAFLRPGTSITNHQPAVRGQIDPQLGAGIRRLPAELQARAAAWVADGRHQRYWFNPEFRNSGEVFKQTGRGQYAEMYDRLSGAAHGGFLGLRLFKDDPERIDPGPRRDRRSQSRALSYSSEILLEILHDHGIFEGFAGEESYIALRSEHEAIVQTFSNWAR